MDDTISRQAAIELFKDDIAAVNELNNLPFLPDRMKYVQESVNIIMNTCKSDSIKDKAFRNAARMIQNAIDGEAPDFETIEELPSAQPNLDEWCDDCKEYDQERHSCPRWNRVIRQTVEDMKAAQPGWIPWDQNTRKSMVFTLQTLYRLAYNIHGVMDAIDEDNIKRLSRCLEGGQE